MTEDALCSLVSRIIEAIGDDPSREGVVDTPARVVRSWQELFSGYHIDPCEHLSRRFASTADQMVRVDAIPFFSTCEHHMLPFVGTVDVAYIPRGFVVGLSKLPRLVDGYARRLQIQEQLTEQIATAIEMHLSPDVGVRVVGEHYCMKARGIRSHGAMTTVAIRGAFRDASVRAEWLGSRA